MNGPTPLDGGSLHVPARYTPILLALLREAARQGSPLPEVRDLFEACGVAAREALAARMRAGLPRLPEAISRPAETAPPLDHLSVVAAATRLGCTDRRVRQLISAGALSARRVGPRGRWEIDRQALDQYERGRAA
jgi:excisionase family DNA binding protein